jgi:hypothetical protein
MTDESYQKGLTHFLQNAMQGGNFYAVEALRKAGVEDVLPEETRTKLEDQYARYGAKVLGKAAQDPGIVNDLLMLEIAKADPKSTPLGVAGMVTSINGKLRRMTGLDMDLMDYKDAVAAGGSVVSAMAAQARRLEDRQFQREEREITHAYARADKAADEQVNAAQVQAAWAMGSPLAGVASGLKPNDFDMLAMNDYRSGNLTHIARSYDKEQWTSRDTASIMQAKLTSSLGKSYTKDFDTGYKEWQALNSASHGAAASYYGKYHVMMQAFDSLSRGGMNPEAAYVRAFGDPSRYSVARIPPDRR